jgi:hypothetical protein
MEFIRDLPVVAEPDVLVCGCGCAGVTAAIAAGRLGASTMVVERAGFAGGYLTGVTGAALDGFVDLRTGIPIIGGIAYELAQLTAGVKGDPMSARYPPSNDLREMRETPGRTPIRYNLEQLKLQSDRLMRQAGVHILYHTQIADVIRDADRIVGVVIANKGGLGVIRPKTVIDATGDGDVAAWAGVPFDSSKDMQPMSLHFRIANVKNISAELRDTCSKVLDQAHAEGKLKIYGGPWMGRLAPGELYFNATRFPGNGINPEDLTAGEIQGREDANLMYELFREHVPEFKEAYLVCSGPFVGVRETRRIRGDGTLTWDDILTNRVQKDAVLKGAWYVDQHPTDKSGYHVHVVVRPYDISYSTLVPQQLSNTWVAGRCHSADSRAMASSRVTVTAMGMGQAAGTAAALSLQNRTDSRGLSTTTLQSQLLKDGALILERAEELLKIGDALGKEIPQSAAR